MVKTIEDNSSYEPCIRSYRWLKLKRDYLEQSLSDTLDLLVIGAKFGEGKRTGFYGTLLMASYNQEKDRYETTGLVGSGFSDESLKLIYEVLKDCIIPEPQDDYFVLSATGGKEVLTLESDRCLVLSEDGMRDTRHRRADLAQLHLWLR